LDDLGIRLYGWEENFGFEKLQVPRSLEENVQDGPLLRGLLGGGFKYCMFYFHPYLGKIPILTNIFQMG